jgi:hypothetical protein
MPFYYQQDGKLWFSAAEDDFRDADDNSTLDETNAAGDTFYHLGMSTVVPLSLWQPAQRTYSAIAGVADWGKAYTGNYPPAKLAATGPFFDWNCMYFDCCGCTTTGASDPYTHTYATTTARADPAPSTQLYNQLGHTTAGEIRRTLYTGCCVNSFAITGNMGQPIQYSQNWVAASNVAATALNTEPTFFTKRPFLFSDLDVTFQDGSGTDYDGYCRAFTFNWNNNLKMPIYAGDDHAQCVQYAGNREIRCSLTWATEETDDWDDVEDMSPYEGSGTDYVDLTLKISRDTSTDYVELKGEKLLAVSSTHQWADGVLVHQIELIHVPHADSKWTLVAKNGYDNTRYEGS